jgi:quercetin dioxygenase-like cupin family protein
VARVDVEHAAFREAAALEALGVLPQAASDSLRAHLHECAVCMNEYRGLRPVADLLGHEVEFDGVRSEPLDPHGLKARVMRAAQAARPPKADGAYAVRAVPVADLIEYGPGVKWAVVPANGATIVYWAFDPPECTHVPAESHYFAQLGVVIKGKMSMTFGDGTQEHYGPNELYAIAPGMVHGANFSESTILVEVYTPSHIDFEAQFAKQRGLVDKEP